MQNLLTKTRIEALDDREVLSIGVLSDTRPVRGHIWPEMLEELNHKHDPDIIVNGGDFTDWSRRWEYREYVEMIEPYKHKMVHVMGNHDNRLFGTAYFRKHFGPTDFVIEHGDWILVFVRNAYTLCDGLKRRQRDWLSDMILGDYQHNKVCLFAHVPQMEYFGGFLNKNKLVRDDYMREVLAKVDLSVFGHAHLLAACSTTTGISVVSGGGAPKLYPVDRFIHKIEGELRRYAWSVNHSLIINLHQGGAFDINMVRRGGDLHPDYRIEGPS